VDRGWARRLAAVLGWGPVASLREVLARYDAAGGGLLAGGLAYMALFALVPLTFLVAGILGLVVADAAARASVVDTIANVLPPLRGIVRLVLDEAAGAAGAISLVGGVALVWGASRFVVAFESAMGRIFGGTRRRGFLVRNASAIAAVACLIGAAVLGATLTGVSSFLDAAQAAGVPVDRFMNDVGFALVPLLVAGLSIGLVYRFVPVLAPGWRAILPPAVAVAVVLDVLARAFVFVAPRLIGAAATIGALASAFVALAWLSLSFQAILLGAAWVRQRDSEWGVREAAPREPVG
jgi:membrane protein